MSSTPYSVIGTIVAPPEASLVSTRVYAFNSTYYAGEQIEANYDPTFDTTGLFNINLGNFDHGVAIGDVVRIYAIDLVSLGGSGYRKSVNISLGGTPQYIDSITLEIYDVDPPVIRSMYFLEGAYTNQRENHLITVVEDAHSMEITGPLLSPVGRISYHDSIVVYIDGDDGTKNFKIYFYDENENYAEGFISIIYDTIKPIVIDVLSVEETKINVEFSEYIKNITVLADNFRIPGLTIRSVVLLPDNKTVQLTTDRMFSIIYTMNVRNIEDLAGNVIDEINVSFNGYPRAGFDWTDPDLESDTYLIRKIHLDEIRQNAQLRGVQPPVTGWTNPIINPPGEPETDIDIRHWIEARNQVNSFYRNKYGRSISWVSGPMIEGLTNLKADHILELRAVIDSL